jgi:hypothetical protein
MDLSGPRQINEQQKQITFFYHTNFVAAVESGAGAYDRSPVRAFFRPETLSLAFLKIYCSIDIKNEALMNMN